MCENYLLTYHENDIIEILESPDENGHFSINIIFSELYDYDTQIGNDILLRPEVAFQNWDTAIQKVQAAIIQKAVNECLIKKNTHCRIYSLPIVSDLHRNKCPTNEDTNKFLQLDGTIVKMTAMKMLEYQRQYLCTKCKYVMTVDADFEKKNMITPPKHCGNPEGCNGKNVIATSELGSVFCKDYQEIKVQETINKLDVESMPNSIWVTLEDDLVDVCKPGDNITVCGIVKRRSNPFFVGKKIDVELVVKANHILVNNDNATIAVKPEMKDMFQGFWKSYADTPLVARNIIVKSICPQLYGMFVVKLAVAIVLAGGSYVSNTYNTGVKVRSEPHLLLVGDPGTGKSHLLRFASKIVPRSVLSTGVGSTAAGLTVAAVSENGEWQLEAGALVLADGGICCIDEFNSMKEHDRTSIHEAMEQQTISVAKASMVSKLSTRCSILAATNPKNNLDPTQPLSMNIALASPMLSRFDLILLLRDKIDDDYDSKLVDYIFSSQSNAASVKLEENINWTLETLQSYFALIKKINPVLTEESNRILSSYYQIQRRKSNRNKSRTTVRLLESLVRLSQGHARLMYHQKVEVVDAVMAVVLIETAMETHSSLFRLQVDVRNDFPDNPTKDYKKIVVTVLRKLELDDLLQKELHAIKKPPDQPKADEAESKFLHNAGPSGCPDEENTAKRRKSDGESGLKRKKMDTKTKDRDLAALQCFPSIHDIFPSDDEPDVRLEPAQPQINETLIQNAETAIQKDDPAEKPLSQRSKTKQYLNKFRFSATKEQEVEVSTNSTVLGDKEVVNHVNELKESNAKQKSGFKFRKVSKENQAASGSLLVFENQEDIDDLNLDISLNL